MKGTKPKIHNRKNSPQKRYSWYCWYLVLIKYSKLRGIAPNMGFEPEKS